MKIWKKVLIPALIISIVAAAVVVLATQINPTCCLCSSFRYHAPCLIDLETGYMVELALYDPHPTNGAELAEKQSHIDTFSFVGMGDVKGTKMTGSRIIEINVPVTGKAYTFRLCKDCQKQLPDDYRNRYILADLYDADLKKLIPLESGIEMNIRCYEITMKENFENGKILVTIQGSLDIYNQD